MNSTFKAASWDARLLVVVAAGAVAVGLVFAFIGLGVNGFWYDELFTAWVIGQDHDPTALWGRIISDLHPPGYYASIWAWAQVFGTSEVALRVFSGLCACGSVLVFLVGTRQAFSLPGRLFAAAIATGSFFWFIQAQNARSNALTLLLAAMLLALELRLLVPPDARRTERRDLALIAALLLFSALTHLYLALVGVASLAIVALFRRDLVIVLGSLAVVQIAVAIGYLKLVIVPNSKFSTTDIWIPATPAWFAEELADAGKSAISLPAFLALILAAVSLLWRREDEEAGPVLTPPAWLCFGTPLLVFALGVISSLVISPNVTDRNLLTAAPFAWGVLARMYDFGPARARRPQREIVHVVLVVAVLASAAIALARPLPQSEPYREASMWIRAIPGCRGATIPVQLTTAPAGGVAPGFEQSALVKIVSHYLEGFAPIVVTDMLAHEAPPDFMALMRRRAAGADTCPVILWAAHGPENGKKKAPFINRLATELGGNVRLKTFVVWRQDGIWHRSIATMFILYAAPPVRADTPTKQP